jgi:beta-mannanase
VLAEQHLTIIFTSLINMVYLRSWPPRRSSLRGDTRKMKPSPITKITTALVSGLILLSILLSGGLTQQTQPQAVHAFGTDGSMQLGVYPQGYITQAVIDAEIQSLDTWAEKRVSIAGITLEIDDPNPQLGQLSALWDNGVTPFINLKTGYFSQPTAAQLASGQYDAAFANWAQAYAAWATSGKWAFIALFPEMNLPWVSYGMDPVNYKAAYTRIQSIFNQNGVPVNAVRWVFSVNGWSQYVFASYYPGDEHVDIVGFTAFNYGYCSAASNPSWINPADLFTSTIRSLRSLAPAKSIFVTSLGTSAYFTAGQKSTTAKNQWLVDAYNFLADALGVQAVIYYNINNSWECDWAMYKLSGDQYTGYRSGVANSEYDYTSPSDLGLIDFDLNLFTLNLPAVFKDHHAWNSSHPMLTAIYPKGWPGLQTTMDDEVHPMDTWANKRSSIIATYVDIENDYPPSHVKSQLETIWENGYTPFVNMPSSRTASAIASGKADAGIRNWAIAYKQYAEEGGGRRAFIAPLQEMNGYWVTYGLDPSNFKLAYRRIQTIFAQEGVPANSVWWTFAPNGYGDTFENYYPGQDYVDVVAFSSYNFGYNPNNPWPRWETGQEIYAPYLDRMRVMAPTKPIIVAQTGTTAYTSSGYSIPAKDQWLRDTYLYSSNYSGLLAIIYENAVNYQGYDWPIYVPGVPSKQFQGYVDALVNPDICYIPPNELKTLDLYQLSIP